MPCYHPLTGYLETRLTESGKHAWAFSRSKKLLDPVQVPCGRCIGCKLERSRQWSVRCLHESQMHAASCFVTLTYNDKYLPHGGGLQHTHFQDFMKALRPLYPVGIRYFMCGEYGENLGRPHYHALLFGVDFADKKPHSKTEAGECIYTSDVLTKLWRRGFASIGAMTLESAAYCARYSFKKISGSKASRHYSKIDPATGEIIRRRSEYVQMSRRTGLGKGWLTCFKSDVYPRDEVIVKGQIQKPPRYYDQQLSETEKAPIAENRKAIAKASLHNTPARLEVREAVKLAKIKQLKRSLT